MTHSFQIGDVVVARFPEHVPRGREQEGYRPALVVALPEELDNPRFDIVIVVPMTTARGQVWGSQSPRLYPTLAAGVGGLPADSIVLIDQLRALDLGRIHRRLGKLGAAEWTPIQTTIKGLFRL